MKTPRTAHCIGNGAKSSGQRLWPPTPCHVWGNSAHDSSTGGSHNCRDRLLKDSCCDKVFLVATKFSLSQQSLHDLMSQQSFMCRDRAWGWEGRSVRARQLAVSVHCACDEPVIVHCVVHCLGHYAWTLFTNTVHGHC